MSTWDVGYQLLWQRERVSVKPVHQRRNLCWRSIAVQMPLSTDVLWKSLSVFPSRILNSGTFRSRLFRQWLSGEGWKWTVRRKSCLLFFAWWQEARLLPRWSSITTKIRHAFSLTCVIIWVVILSIFAESVRVSKLLITRWYKKKEVLPFSHNDKCYRRQTGLWWNFQIVLHNAWRILSVA